MAEQLICNQQVAGSNPTASSYYLAWIDMGICSMCKYYGEVPEWPKGTDCKSVGIAFGGSNPPLPIF